MEDDFPISEQDFEDSDDTGWYWTATWAICLGEFVFQYQMLQLHTNLGLMGC